MDSAFVVCFISLVFLAFFLFCFDCLSVWLDLVDVVIGGGFFFCLFVFAVVAVVALFCFVLFLFLIFLSFSAFVFLFFLFFFSFFFF